MTAPSRQPAKTEDRIQGLLKTDGIKKRFEEMLGKRAPAFLSSIISAVNSNPSLKKCEPMSIISSAAIAAAMDLPINPSLGFAHIVPYKDHAQFQIGWKGFVQLGMRSGQYKTINIVAVHEGQLKKHNFFTGEMEFDSTVESKGTPTGYLLYFKLLNGYEKYFYMTHDQCLKHGKRYSKAFAGGWGPWKDDFDAMALKTVTKMGLSKYGVLSIEMQKALETDQGEISESGDVAFPDAPDKPEEEPTEPKKKSSRLSKIVENATADTVDAEFKNAPPPEAPKDEPI